jgi:hypothetical protein
LSKVQLFLYCTLVEQHAIYTIFINELSTNEAMKKSQVSIFILLGVLLLAGIAWFVFSSEPSPVQKLPTLATTPEQIFIRSCFSTIAQEAVSTSAMSGGYLDLSVLKQSQLVQKDAPFLQSGVPLYIYNNQQYAPSVETIQQQLSAYMIPRLQDCLASYSDVVESTIHSLTVTINAQSIFFELNYTFIVSPTGSPQTVQNSASISEELTRTSTDFVYELKVPFGSLIEESKQIATKLYTSQFFANMTVDLLSISDPVVPVSNLVFSCKRKEWKVSQVQSELQSIVSSALSQVRVKYAEHSPFEQELTDWNTKGLSGQRAYSYRFGNYLKFAQVTPDSLPTQSTKEPSDLYSFSQLYFDAGLDPQTPYTLFFSASPRMTIAIDPAQNGVLKSSYGQGPQDYLRFICLQTYHFTYDIKYTVFAHLFVDQAFDDGSSLVFRFGLPVLVQDNTPVVTDFTPTQIEPSEYDQNLCADTAQEHTTIIVKDASSGYDLSGVEVDFVCKQYYCPLGLTSVDSTLTQAQLVSSIPEWCSPKKLSLKKAGYLSKTATYQSGDVFVTDMYPTIQIPLTAVLGPKLAGVTTTAVDESMDVSVIVTNLDIDYTTSAVLNSTSESSIELLKAITRYNISAYVTDKSGSLIGGYQGEFNTTIIDPLKQLQLHLYDFVSKPVSVDEEYERLLFLEQNTTYKSDFGPIWVLR